MFGMLKFSCCLHQKLLLASLMELLKTAVAFHKGIYLHRVSKSLASIHLKRVITVLRSYFLRAATIPKITTNAMPTKLIKKPRITEL